MNGDVAAYLLDNYGECLKGRPHCAKLGCAKFGWRGRDCPNWKPLGVTTLEELAAKQREEYETKRALCRKD